MTHFAECSQLIDPSGEFSCAFDDSLLQDFVHASMLFPSLAFTLQQLHVLDRNRRQVCGHLQWGYARPGIGVLENLDFESADDSAKYR